MTLISAKQAEATPEDVEMVAIKRTNGAPLRFKGWPVIRQDHSFPTLQGQVTLWQCKTGGFVVQLDLDLDDGLHCHASRVRSVQDALSFLEALNCDIPAMPEPRPARTGRRVPVGEVAEHLLTRSRNIAARDAFDQLIAASSAACSAAITARV